MSVIFEAFIVFSQNNKCNAELIQESVKFRLQKGKVVHSYDYHDNFTEKIFQELFVKLCRTLKEK